jgi:hypothetical protein
MRAEIFAVEVVEDDPRPPRTTQEDHEDEMSPSGQNSHI